MNWNHPPPSLNSPSVSLTPPDRLQIKESNPHCALNLVVCPVVFVKKYCTGTLHYLRELALSFSVLKAIGGTRAVHEHAVRCLVGFSSGGNLKKYAPTGLPHDCFSVFVTLNHQLCFYCQLLCLRYICFGQPLKYEACQKLLNAYSKRFQRE